MQSADFQKFHRPALDADEIRHSLLLSMIGRLPNLEGMGRMRTWTLGGPGQCAIQNQGYPIVLGNLSNEQCRALAELTQEDDYSGVVGPDDTALQFAAHAKDLGIEFSEEIPQQIQALRTEPAALNVPGFARPASLEDFEIFRTWTLAFIREAVPNDPIPDDEALSATLAQDRHWFWSVDGKAVSMAAIARKTKNAATVNSVFTPLDFRNRGFAGAIVAAVARRIFLEGRNTVCLYIDLRNPASNRCYAKLGFQPVCSSWLIIRRKSPRL
jgi:predicted GNAT family acetyltransferase